MAEAIDAPEEMSLHAPRIITMKVPVDKIGEVIGPKGKVINQIQDDTGATLSIEDDGTVYIGATNGEAAEAARAAVNAIANPTMPEVGERYLGTVVKTTNFGAFVSLLPGKDGLLHISKLRALAGGKRVENVEDVVSVGQKIQVQIAEIDDRGKLSLVPVVEDDAVAVDEADAEAWPRLRSRPTLSRAGEARDDSDEPPRRRTPDRPARAVCGSSPSSWPASAPPASGSACRWAPGTRRRAAQRRVALPRAPAVQGHPDPLGAGHLHRPRRGRRGVQRLHRARSTPASTRGCSTRTCRWRSTCSATWSPPR